MHRSSPQVLAALLAAFSLLAGLCVVLDAPTVASEPSLRATAGFVCEHALPARQAASSLHLNTKATANTISRLLVVACPPPHDVHPQQCSWVATTRAFVGFRSALGQPRTGRSPPLAS